MSGRFTVLLYHGVYDAGLAIGAKNSSGKHISSTAFEAQMAYIARHCPLVSMRQIALAYAGKGDLPEGAVAVTFDDGFLNNRNDAWPIMERHRIPATIYLATGFIGTGRMIWSDVLEASILDSRPEALVLAETERRKFDLRSEAGKIEAFTEIKQLCKSLPDERKNAVVRSVTEQLGTPRADHPLYAFLDWDQVRDMDRSPLIDFGAHTVDHVSLARVPPGMMQDQIDRSVATLERELGHKCGFFSYPEGQSSDYNASVIDYLRAKGFDHSPSAIDGANDFSTIGPFDIRRIMVGFQGRPFPFSSN